MNGRKTPEYQRPTCKPTIFERKDMLQALIFVIHGDFQSRWLTSHLEDLAERLKVPQEQQRLLDGDRELQDGDTLPNRSAPMDWLRNCTRALMLRLPRGCVHVGRGPAGRHLGGDPGTWVRIRGFSWVWWALRCARSLFRFVRSVLEMTLIKRPPEQAKWRFQMQQGMVEKLKERLYS